MSIRQTICALLAPVAAFAAGLTTGSPAPISSAEITAGAIPAALTRTFGTRVASMGAPEVDTGGFFLYMPSYATMKRRAALGLGSWVGDAWSSPDWDLVGFAHFTSVPGQYKGSIWMATPETLDTGLGTIKKMSRPGSELSSLRLGAPILYLPVPNGYSTVIKKEDFISLVNDLLGTSSIDASASTADFALWDVDETKK